MGRSRAVASLGAALALGAAALFLLDIGAADAQGWRNPDAGSADAPPRIENAEPVDPMDLIRDLEGEPRPDGRESRGEEPSSGWGESPSTDASEPATSDPDAARNAEPESNNPDGRSAETPAERPAGADIDRLERSLLEGGAAPLREYEPAPPVPGVRVVLRGLDKMTGDLGETEASIGETAKLWRLEIDVRACYSRVEASQSAAGSAFLQIRDTKKAPAETVFSGWMFAASPALSAMDHPRYDVWVLSCSTS